LSSPIPSFFPAGQDFQLDFLDDDGQYPAEPWLTTKGLEQEVRNVYGEGVSAGELGRMQNNLVQANIRAQNLEEELKRK
jgi:hypothetical protein